MSPSSSSLGPAAHQYSDFAPLVKQIYENGIAGLPSAFSRKFIQEIAEDFEKAFQQALSFERGVVSRGPERYYFAIHPEQLRGFADLVQHPWVTGLCEQFLGPDYEFVEIGFDVPLPGAMYQPWHRDFPMPDPTRRERKLTSLAFNLTTVDVTPEMGPFEIAPGTHWDDDKEFNHAMFPPKPAYDRYEERRSPRCAQMGDISARTGLCIHRGTPNRSNVKRPVMILGAVSSDVRIEDSHMVVMSRDYYHTLPASLQSHLRVLLMNELHPLQQSYSIEGLVMGGEPEGEV